MARPKKQTESPRAKTAVIYARVSTKEQQEEGYSIDAQIKLLEEYCARRELKVVHRYVEAATAKESGRVEFKRMLKMVAAEKVDAIVVEKVDRLYRNLPDAVKVGELNIELHLAKENAILSESSRSHEKFMHDIRLVVAKNYIDNLKEETRKGMQEKASQGIWPSFAPIGYANVCDESGRRVIEPDAMAPIIAEIFHAYAERRVSLSQATSYAYTLGLRTKKGGKVFSSSVHLILKNPIYCGVIRWNGKEYEGKHTPIIERRLYDKVQAVMEGRSGSRAGFGNYEFAYGGLITCGRCGGKITAELKKGKYIYYHCSAMRQVDGVVCSRSGVREEDLTETIARSLEGLTIRPDVLECVKQALRESYEGERELHDQQTSALESEKKKLQKSLEQLYVDKINGEVPASVYQNLKAKWEEQLAEVNVGIRAFEFAEREYFNQGNALLELCANAHHRFKSADSKLRRQMVISLYSNLVLEGKNLALEMKPWFKLVVKANTEMATTLQMEQGQRIWLPAKDSNLD